MMLLCEPAKMSWSDSASPLYLQLLGKAGSHEID